MRRGRFFLFAVGVLFFSGASYALDEDLLREINECDNLHCDHQRYEDENVPVIFEESIEESVDPSQINIKLPQFNGQPQESQSRKISPRPPSRSTSTESTQENEVDSLPQESETGESQLVEESSSSTSSNDNSQGTDSPSQASIPSNPTNHSPVNSATLGSNSSSSQVSSSPNVYITPSSGSTVSGQAVSTPPLPSISSPSGTSRGPSVQVHNGMIYRGDSSTQGNESTTRTLAGPSSQHDSKITQSDSGRIDPVTLNKQNQLAPSKELQDKKSDQEQSVSSSYPSVPRATNGANRLSPSTSPTNNAVNETAPPKPSFLERVALALGINSFFSTSSSASSTSPKSLPLNSKQQTDQRRRISSQKMDKLKSAKEILKEHWKQGLRNPAKSLEFGSTEDPIFSTMCQHYRRYAAVHSIRSYSFSCGDLN